MTALYTVILFCTIGFAIADRDIACVFEETEINPDVVDKSPRELLEIKFGDKIVEPGEELTPTEVKDMPEIHYKHESGVFYTLIMTEPDSPSREAPSYREWHQWLVGNIPGEDISKGEVLSEFVSSAPSKDTGLHRYAFLVYKQPGKIEFDEKRLSNKSIVGRDGFSTKKFAAKYNLGDPIAGNVYQTQYDDYVPFLHAQLGL